MTCKIVRNLSFKVVEAAMEAIGILPIKRPWHIINTQSREKDHQSGAIACNVWES